MAKQVFSIIAWIVFIAVMGGIVFELTEIPFGIISFTGLVICAIAITASCSVIEHVLRSSRDKKDN